MKRPNREQGEQMAAILHRLYQSRTTLRTLWGDSYKARIAEPVALLRDTAKRTGLPELSVMTDMAARAKDHPMALLILLASAVESIEPTP